MQPGTGLEQPSPGSSSMRWTEYPVSESPSCHQATSSTSCGVSCRDNRESRDRRNSPTQDSSSGGGPGVSEGKPRAVLISAVCIHDIDSAGSLCEPESFPGQELTNHITSLQQ
ncbi:hypothetical protein DPEC_G00137520 [Dallia pectoralis]|uniref:Uncharacterized protein n=1 Tax=Dallia pectoralis TaxID=75939 RepID=A0ACC2GLY6_DALPE|nr:hypothetical protein DPEC_G00137520 [Dallia pectoralis]